MQIAFITAMWQRPAIFKLFAAQINCLRNIYGKENIKCFVAGSEGPASEQLALEYGLEYIEYPNKPISRKLDAACQLAKQWDPDYCMMVGSDDLVSKSMMDLYIGIIEQNPIDYLYTLDCYFYDTQTRRALYWAGYRDSANRGHACGAGRMLSRRVMKAIDYRPWMPAYTNARLDGLLDTAMDLQLQTIPHTRHAFKLRDNNAYMVDIKSATNMTRFSQWDNSLFISAEPMLRAAFTEDICNKIFSI